MLNPALSSPKRLALGCMGMAGSGPADDISPARTKKAIEAFEAALVSGITLFDHADIYGGGACETVFKSCLEALPDAREQIQIWSKGGIRRGHYNLSKDYLLECIERSRTRMGIDKIDLFQLHRPDPLAHPAETAEALNQALQSGHIGAVGVSNYFPHQTLALQKYLDVPIVSNQFEINALRLAPFYEGWEVPAFKGYSGGTGTIGDGLLDFCMAHDITPLAYSPLARASLVQTESEDGREQDVIDVISELSQKYDATRTQIALAWLLTHPANIIPIVGSNNPAHIFEAAQRNDLRLEREEWYRVWTASWGRNAPQTENCYFRGAGVSYLNRGDASSFTVALAPLSTFIIPIPMRNFLLILPLLFAVPAIAQDAAPLDKPTPPEGMVYVPAGEFQMGTNNADGSDFNQRDNVPLNANDARPQHKATTGAFFIDVTEVTNAQYQKYCQATGAIAPPFWIGGKIPEGEGNFPVHHVNWYEASAYAKWANKRLPSETEWEKAARGTDGRRFPWGNNWDGNNVVNGGDGPQAVAGRKGGASPYGALDMAGNVAEWTTSWFDGYAGSPTKQPDFGTKLKVVRGGAWWDGDTLNQTWHREVARPQARITMIGFRCVRDAPAQQ